MHNNLQHDRHLYHYDIICEIQKVIAIVHGWEMYEECIMIRSLQRIWIAVMAAEILLKSKQLALKRHKCLVGPHSRVPMRCGLLELRSAVRLFHATLLLFLLGRLLALSLLLFTLIAIAADCRGALCHGCVITRDACIVCIVILALIVRLGARLLRGIARLLYVLWPELDVSFDACGTCSWIDLDSRHHVGALSLTLEDVVRHA